MKNMFYVVNRRGTIELQYLFKIKMVFTFPFFTLFATYEAEDSLDIRGFLFLMRGFSG